MKKGAYLKNNIPEEKQKNRASIEKRQQQKAKHARKRKHNNLLLLVLGAILVLLVVLLLVLQLTQSNNPLKGKWHMDEVTAYEFYDGKNGAMVLPSDEYVFTYSVENDTLSIDFQHEGAKDAQYTFSIEGNTLTLNGGNATNRGTYVLKKSE